MHFKYIVVNGFLISLIISQSKSFHCFSKVFGVLMTLSVILGENPNASHTRAALGMPAFGRSGRAGFGLPMPGPVLGLALLLLIFSVMPTLTERLRPTTTVILANLSFLFVPAGVGVIGSFAVLSEDVIALLAILFLSTVFSMLAAVGTFIGVRYATARWVP